MDMWQHLQFQQRVTATVMTTVTRNVARKSGTGRMPRLQLGLRLQLLLLNLSSLQWAITARLVDTPSSSRGGSIGHQNKCTKNIAPHAGFHFSSAQQRLTPAPTGCSCTILQTHLPHATNSFSTSSSSGAGGCN